VSIAGADASARTLLPNSAGAFKQYKLVFTSDDLESTRREMQVNTLQTALVLAEGTWTLDVTGYADDDATENAATGSTPGIEVSAGVETPVSVALSPTMGGGTGTLAYTITGIPANIPTVTVKIEPLPTGTAKTVVVSKDPAASGEWTGSDVATLNVGYHRVSVFLNTGSTEAVKTEVAHIYRNLTTTGSFDFTNGNFAGATVETGTDLGTLLDQIATDGPGNYTIKLGGNVPSFAADNRTYGIGTTITLISDSTTTRTITLSGTGSLFTVGDGVTLILGTGITLTGVSDNTLPLVKVNGGGVLDLRAGAKITGNTNSITTTNNRGGGVGVIANGTFILNGGEISNNKVTGSTSYGGGVYVTGSGASFIMNDGTISNNTTNTNNSGQGGGVYITGASASFTMKEGSISKNNAGTGGGVYVASSAIFNMTGGIIGGSSGVDGNSASSNNGGGIYLAGPFTMSGEAIISYNQASAAGGGVYSGNVAGVITMSGSARINSNSAGTYGGGVSGSPTMSGSARIDNNSASTYGGGVSGSPTMSGLARIDNNSAGTYGGGVYGTSTMSDSARIDNNTATDGGSGIYLSSSAPLIISGNAQVPRTNSGGNEILMKISLSGTTWYYPSITIDGTGDSIGIDLTSGVPAIPVLSEVISAWTDRQVVTFPEGSDSSLVDRFVLGKFIASDSSPAISDTHKLDNTGKLVAK
jgi:hypothetical protein